MRIDRCTYVDPGSCRTLSQPCPLLTDNAGASAITIETPGRATQPDLRLSCAEPKFEIIHKPGKKFTLCPPLDRACWDVRHGFRLFHEALSLENASEIIVRNGDCKIWSLIHACRDIPVPSRPCKRTLTFDLTFTNGLQQVNLQIFFQGPADMSVYIVRASRNAAASMRQQ